MNADRYTEQAALFVLGALDADERLEFQQHAAGCADCRAEVRAFEAVRDRLPLELAEQAPNARARAALLRAVQPEQAMDPEVVQLSAERPRRRGMLVLLPVAAALLLGYQLWRSNERAGAERARAAAQFARADGLASQLAQTEERLRTIQSHAAALQSLLANPDVRVVTLAGQKDAEIARARVFWNPATNEAMVTVAGLPKPAPGMAYQVWVIASAAPVPAGTFTVTDDGTAVFNMWRVAATRWVKTFAVSVEPAAGVRAPTGPIVLAGKVL
jgi:anti-sigma-K factor RskA